VARAGAGSNLIAMPPSVQAALLGIVQGLTEFLPVSSSAHLILARAFFGYDSERFGLPFDVAVHVGTALAVAVYFRRELAGMIRALPRALSGPGGGGDQASAHDVRLIWLLAVGTVPVVAVGLLFDDVIEHYLRTPGVAAIALTAGAIGFFVVERIGAHARDERSLTVVEAFWIGCAQAAALVPGVSRSGATMTLALLIGLRRAESARFVFLLGLPAIAGAAVKELPALPGAANGGEVATLMLVGIASSAVVGYMAIRFFIQYVGRHSLDVFAWYRLALAALVAVWIVSGGGA
jgi:undecaprenyl-diphosphatase